MKTIKIVFSTCFISIFLFSCALKPTDTKEEEKKYQATIHNVEKANYEFEERLNSFYESEPVDDKDLDKLYKNEYPDGVNEPSSLRIHWKKARELALAELELQKEIQAEWKNAELTERPILVLDRDGGDYYRYYEYRLLIDNFEVGAIRIPVYRRSENFSTSEVHLYSKDGKTYYINPTLWGVYLAKNFREDKTTSFFKKIKEYTDVVVTDSFAFNFLYLIYEELGLSEKVTDVPTQYAYNQLYASYDKHKNEMNGTRKSLSDNDKRLVIDAAVRKDTYDYRDTLTQVKRQLFQLESIALLTEKTRNLLSNIIPDIASIDFFQGLSTIAIKMTDNKADTLMTKTIKDIYWNNVDTKNEAVVREYLLAKEWNIYKELDDREIKPIVEYPEYHKYPQREKKINPKYKFQEYKLLNSIEEHANLIKSISGFISKDGFKSSLFDHLEDANGHEFSESLVDSVNKNENIKRSYSIRNAINMNSLGLGSITDRNDVSEMTDLIASLAYKMSRWGKTLPNEGWGRGWQKKDGYLPLELGVSLIFFPVGGCFVWLDLAIGAIMDAIYLAKKFPLELADKLDNILANIDKELGKEGLELFIEYLGNIKSDSPFKDNKNLHNLISVAEVVAKNYIAYGPGSVKKAFLTVYDWWLVWYVPIFPWPTGAWIVDKGNGEYAPMKDNDYAYFMSVPMDFDLSNIVPPEKNPVEIDCPIPPAKSLNPKLEMVPDKLKPYSLEWIFVNDWLTDNKLFDFNENGSPSYFTKITVDDIGNIVNLFIDNVYDLYEGESLVYINKNYEYKEITNVITNVISVIPPKEEYKTNIINNWIVNPTKIEKDEQNKFNINKLKDIINTNYIINLGTY